MNPKFTMGRRIHPARTSEQKTLTDHGVSGFSKPTDFLYSGVHSVPSLPGVLNRSGFRRDFNNFTITPGVPSYLPSQVLSPPSWPRPPSDTSLSRGVTSTHQPVPSINGSPLHYVPGTSRHGSEVPEISSYQPSVPSHYIKPGDVVPNQGYGTPSIYTSPEVPPDAFATRQRSAELPISPGYPGFVPGIPTPFRYPQFPTHMSSDTQHKSPIAPHYPGFIPGVQTEPEYKSGYPLSGIQQPHLPTAPDFPGFAPSISIKPDHIPSSSLPGIYSSPGQQFKLPTSPDFPGTLPGIHTRSEPVPGYPFLPSSVRGEPQLPSGILPDIQSMPDRNLMPSSLTPGLPQQPEPQRRDRVPDVSQVWHPSKLEPDEVSKSRFPGMEIATPGRQVPPFTRITGYPPQPVQPNISISQPSTGVALVPDNASVPSVLSVALEEKACCQALRELRKRCCDVRSRIQDPNAQPRCCSKKSPTTRSFDYDKDLTGDSGNGGCKVVKAICYIVYKPNGRARICKPTSTTGC